MSTTMVVFTWLRKGSRDHRYFVYRQKKGKVRDMMSTFNLGSKWGVYADLLP